VGSGSVGINPPARGHWRTYHTDLPDPQGRSRATNPHRPPNGVSPTPTPPGNAVFVATDVLIHEVSFGRSCVKVALDQARGQETAAFSTPHRISLARCVTDPFFLPRRS
jgi:hypothetical protein